MVVYNEQLPVSAQFEDFIRLQHERLQTSAQAVFLIARWNDDRQLDQFFRLRLVKDCADTGWKSEQFVFFACEPEDGFPNALGRWFSVLRTVVPQDFAPSRSVL
jgi:hypothetical protein